MSVWETTELKEAGQEGKRKGWREINTDIIQAQGGDTHAESQQHQTQDRTPHISAPGVKHLCMSSRQGWVQYFVNTVINVDVYHYTREDANHSP